MKDHPILFSAPMVRAILAGTKTQTRRPVKPCKDRDIGCQLAACEIAGEINAGDYLNSRYGQPGDRLWVRESFCPIYPQDPNYNGGRPIEYDYAATYTHGDRLGDLIGVRKKWKPSIHMPRRASRISLEVTSVRVQLLHHIREEDAIAEGVERTITADGWRRYCDDPEQEAAGVPPCPSAVSSYASLWEQINGIGSWETNPWVWVVEFRRADP